MEFGEMAQCTAQETDYKSTDFGSAPGSVTDLPWKLGQIFYSPYPSFSVPIM